MSNMSHKHTVVHAPGTILPYQVLTPTGLIIACFKDQSRADKVADLMTKHLELNTYLSGD